ncbi:hypothetical protein DPMN_050463, partial [Dreissena polymorpha]
MQYVFWLFESLVYTWKKIATSVTQLDRIKCVSRCFVSVDVQMASSTDVFLRAAERELWCTCSQRRRRFKKRNIVEKVNVTCKQGELMATTSMRFVA